MSVTTFIVATLILLFVAKKVGAGKLFKKISLPSWLKNLNSRNAFGKIGILLLKAAYILLVTILRLIGIAADVSGNLAASIFKQTLKYGKKILP